jgi:hypothetical protein
MAFPTVAFGLEGSDPEGAYTIVPTVKDLVIKKTATSEYALTLIKDKP